MSDFQPYANSLTPSFGAAIRPSDWRLDFGLASRLRRAYRLTLETPVAAVSLWDTTIGSRHKPIHDALVSDDDALLLITLSNPAQSEIYYGMDSLHVGSWKLMQNHDPPRSYLARFILDTLTGLAEATGAARAWNPETGAQRADETDFESIVAGLDAALGIKIDFPNPFDGEFGIKTSRGIMGQRSPLGLYQAWRSVQLCRSIKGNRILEIGAGVGRAAYYAHLMGIDYTIVDLPLSNVGQAVFLGTVLGPDKVWMPGDPPELQPNRIRIVPPNWIKETNETFDLMVNVDSLTEMSPGQAIEYFQFAYGHSEQLFSINHEANEFRVFDLPRMTGVSVRSTRHACAVRPGYIEELFFNELAARHRPEPPPPQLPPHPSAQLPSPR